MGHKEIQYGNFIEEFKDLISKYFTFDSDDFKQRTFKMKCKEWDIMLTLKPK